MGSGAGDDFLLESSTKQVQCNLLSTANPQLPVKSVCYHGNENICVINKIKPCASAIQEEGQYFYTSSL